MTPSRTPTEAILLAGGKGERLGDAARGRPKPLVPVAGRPLASYTLARLAEAGVETVLVSCARGTTRGMTAPCTGAKN